MMTSESDLICLCYVSTARLDFTPEALTELLTSSKQRNQSRSITGLLCFSDRSFMQFLEGHPGQVLPLFESINRDSRHGNCLVLYQNAIAERAFPHWSMALSDVACLSPDQRALFGDIHMVSRLYGVCGGSYPRRLETLLQSFIRCMRDNAA